ncbi:MAG: lysine 2,3-aminomutase [Deltaproteobacteria bacterium HGW-Deltaproteobacteria-6]|nr:MAG: lysine 2,3-aminomutase [Deltaproteobacteria bacterium HGW-Deltaproteobacteria-6]
MNKKFLHSPFQTVSARDWRDWRWQFQNRITSMAGLAGILGKQMPRTEKLRPVLSSYPMAITPYYLSLIQEGDENDPLTIQCIPDIREISVLPNCSEDPLNEDRYMPAPKLIHRYPDRALAIVTKTCATYCRHCNRKRFWKTPETSPLKSRLAKMVRYVADSPEIREVILSGGDPLIYDDEKLEMILAAFAAIPHVEILRIGSRMPAVLPMRITKDLCRMLKRYRPLWFNTQFNHPSEITSNAARACNMLQEAGIPVSNQSVLLKGVNDSSAVMERLLYGLQKISVRPYYLFHCEPVKGCGHFRTDRSTGLAMIETLRGRCSGLSLPQYVADLPGEAGKVPLLALSETMKKNFDKHQDFFDFF